MSASLMWEKPKPRTRVNGAYNSNDIDMLRKVFGDDPWTFDQEHVARLEAMHVVSEQRNGNDVFFNLIELLAHSAPIVVTVEY